MPSSSTSGKPPPTQQICHQVRYLNHNLLSPPPPPPTFVNFVATSDIVLSLPNLKQLDAGEFDLDELVKKLAEVLADGF